MFFYNHKKDYKSYFNRKGNKIYNIVKTICDIINKI